MNEKRIEEITQNLIRTFESECGNFNQVKSRACRGGCRRRTYSGTEPCRTCDRNRECEKGTWLKPCPKLDKHSRCSLNELWWYISQLESEVTE